LRDLSSRLERHSDPRLIEPASAAE
jgi:hypothetical protein